MTKKVVNFLGKKCTATDKKILASHTKKGPTPYVGMGPQMVNPALIIGNKFAIDWLSKA